MDKTKKKDFEEYKKELFKSVDNEEHSSITEIKKNHLFDKLLLEYELTQHKIDNYGKTIIQLRGIVIATVGVILGITTQNGNSFMFGLLLFSIILMFGLIEADKHIQQQKLIKHILDIENNQYKIYTYKFTLAKKLSSNSINYSFILKNPRKLWFYYIVSAFIVFFMSLSTPKNIKKEEIIMICKDRNKNKIISIDKQIKNLELLYNDIGNSIKINTHEIDELYFRIDDNITETSLK